MHLSNVLVFFSQPPESKDEADHLSNIERDFERKRTGAAFRTKLVRRNVAGPPPLTATAPPDALYRTNKEIVSANQRAQFRNGKLSSFF